jgi:tetratricopeptide (TPR) repeat protein
MTLIQNTPVSKDVSQKFIGRADALDAFYRRFAYRHMKNGIYYYGDGGLGKTWILRKILLDSRNDPIRTVTDIVDFFDTQNHNIRGLQATIKLRLQNAEAFDPYDQALLRLMAARSRGEVMHSSAIANLEARVDSLFIECCKEAIISREVVMLFDTFERVQQQYVGRWLLREFFPRVRSLIVVVAGRPIPTPAQMPDNFVSHKLTGIELRDATGYIQRSIPTISKDEADIIWSHTDGVPLLIDLILDLPGSKREHFLVELNRLQKGELVQNTPNLKRALVGQFALPTNLNKVIWAMAYLRRRFDIQMLRYLVEKVKWLPDDYNAVFDEIRQFIYVKEYPEHQNHLLHDVVQEMVAEYILKEVTDPWQEMQAPLYDLIVNHYYPETMETADAQLAHQLQAEQLGYVLDTDPITGLDQYKTYRNDIEITHDYDFEELLWGEIREHLAYFESKGYEVCLERGRWLQKHSVFKKAEEHYRQMVSLFEEQPIEIRQSLGFVLMRLGEIQEARTVFMESRALVKKDDYETISMIDNNLGQAARVQGEWDLALEYYARSFRAATLARNQARMASVYINRGYLYSMQGLYANGIEQCEHALGLLASLPGIQENIQRMIYAKMNLGTSYRHSGDFLVAAQNYEESLKLANQNENREAICGILQHLGINEHLRGREARRRHEDLTMACKSQLQAWQYLTEALEIAQESNWRNAIGTGLNRLAKVYREIHRLNDMPSNLIEAPGPSKALQELQSQATTYEMPFEVEFENDLITGSYFVDLSWLAKAERLFEVSALIADERNDFHLALDSLIEVARTLEEIGLENKVPTVIRRIERVKGYDYQERLFAAMSVIILGDLEFKKQNFEVALERYKEGYVAIAKETGYAAYLLNDRMRDLEWRLREMPLQTLFEWCDALENEWLKHSLLSTRPTMVDLLERVRIEALA